MKNGNTYKGGKIKLHDTAKLLKVDGVMCLTTIGLSMLNLDFVSLPVGLFNREGGQEGPHRVVTFVSTCLLQYVHYLVYSWFLSVSVWGCETQWADGPPCWPDPTAWLARPPDPPAQCKTKWNAWATFSVIHVYLIYIYIYRYIWTNIQREREGEREIWRADVAEGRLLCSMPASWHHGIFRSLCWELEIQISNI